MSTGETHGHQSCPPEPTSTTLGQGMKARLLMSALPPCYLCFETNCDIFQVSMFLALIFFL